MPAWLAWSSPASAYFGSIPPLSARDEAALAGIAERLRAHRMTARFGVRLDGARPTVMQECCVVCRPGADGLHLRMHAGPQAC